MKSTHFPISVTLINCVLVVAGALTPAVGGLLYPPILDRRSYSSNSGRFALLVDPTDIYGAGAASYALTEKGEEVWRRQQPFTLWDARVTDDGTVVGYAYSTGLGARKGNGNLHVVALSPRGVIQMDDLIPRENSPTSETPPVPYAAGLLLDVENDRFVLRVAGRTSNDRVETWWEYRLSTKRRERVFRPAEEFKQSNVPNRAFHQREIVAADAVRGTRLVLVHWQHRDRDLRGISSVFELIDARGKRQWSIELPHRSAIFCSSEGDAQFSLMDAGTSERVRFAVRNSGNGDWVVSECQRSATKLPTVIESSVNKNPQAVRMIGRIDLIAPDDPTQDPRQHSNAGLLSPRAKTFAAINSDNQGQIYALSRTTGAVHVFGPRGQVIRSFSTGLFRKDTQFRVADWITIARGGDFYIRVTDTAPRHNEYYEHYSALGEPIGLESFGTDEDQWYCQGTTDKRWVVGFARVYLADTSGALLRSISRCPDERWLNRPRGASVAPDGSFAVIARREVNLFDASGGPVAMAPLPPFINELTAMVAHDRSIVVIADRGELLVLAHTGEVTHRARLPGTAGVRTVLLPIRGEHREVQIFDGIRTIYRYELPPGIDRSR
jgi:hypothetical protein